MRYRTLFMAAAGAMLALPAFAQLQTVHVANPWIRFITPGTPAAGYFTITNVGTRPVIIVGASSPDCASVMLHRSQNVGGTEHMDEVPSVSVPAHGEVRFEPGGYHLMCMSPSSKVVAGSRVPVTLTFQDKRTMTKGFVVRGAKGS
jgi:hypothetical protein